MMKIPSSFVETIRERVVLSDVIGRRILLRRAGHEYKGLCPFHQERTPSFSVNDQKGFYHCFGCGAHGDVVAFMMRYETLSYTDTISSLATLLGLSVPRMTEQEVQHDQHLKTLHTLLDTATTWFEHQLKAPTGRAALSYLHERGLDQETITRFRLGFAPSDGTLLRQHLRAADYSQADMIAVGLLKESEDHRLPYSFFRNRLMFPVHNHRRRVVGFGGRLVSGEGAKYLNSPETSLFHKTNLLYEPPDVRTTGNEKHSLIVVEGYMDVITLAKAGLPRVVAPLGTSLTAPQIMSLWKHMSQPEKVPILCFDGDAAGRRASYRAMTRVLPLLKPSHSLRVAFLTEGYDPDRFVRSFGLSAFVDLIDQARSLIDAVWQMEAEGRLLDTPEAKAGFKRALEERITQITDRTVQSLYRHDLRQRFEKTFGWSTSKRRQRSPFTQTYHQPMTSSLSTDQLSEITDERTTITHKNDRIRRIILGTLLIHPAAITELEDLLGMIEFQPEPMAALYQALLSAVDEGYGDDPEELQHHLRTTGHHQSMKSVLDESTFQLASFTRRCTPLDEVVQKLRNLLMIPCMEQLQSQENSMIQAYFADPSNRNRQRLEAIKQERKRLDSWMLESSTRSVNKNVF